MKKSLLVWRFKDAPQEYQDLSENGGDEDWILFIPLEWGEDGKSPWIPWADDDTEFGIASVQEFQVGNGWVRIGSHA